MPDTCSAYFIFLFLFFSCYDKLHCKIITRIQYTMEMNASNVLIAICWTKQVFCLWVSFKHEPQGFFGASLLHRDKGSVCLFGSPWQHWVSLLKKRKNQQLLISHFFWFSLLWGIPFLSLEYFALLCACSQVQFVEFEYWLLLHNAAHDNTGPMTN